MKTTISTDAMDGPVQIADRQRLYTSPVKTVLIADDSEHGEALSNLLRPHGCLPTVVRNPGQFRSAAALERFDCVITELIFPQQTGFELCHFIKTQWPQTPVLIVTEVDLESARNLAIWAGADGYVTKPVVVDDFYWLVRDVAEALRDTLAADPVEVNGTVEFQCGCGAHLREKMENAGKRTACRRCRRIVAIPALRPNVNALANMPGANAADRDRVGFFCRNCGSWLHLLQLANCRKTVCQKCLASTPIPEWIARRRKFFLARDRHPTERQTLLPFNPARYVTVRCAKCSTYYQLSTDEIENVQSCSSCGEGRLIPSIEGAPLSRAALASTGRLFAYMNPGLGHRIFLLPQTGHVNVGSGSDMGVCLRDLGLRPRHARLMNTLDGPQVTRIDPEGLIRVNDQPVSVNAVLRPGDVLQLGAAQLLLNGFRNLDEHFVFRNVREDQSLKDRTTTLESRITRQAARILQLHWQIAQNRMQNQARSASATPQG